MYIPGKVISIAILASGQHGWWCRTPCACPCLLCIMAYSIPRDVPWLSPYGGWRLRYVSWVYMHDDRMIELGMPMQIILEDIS